MRPYIYILLLAAIAMFYKTFYLDYKKQEIPAEANLSIEAAAPVAVQPAEVAPQLTAPKAEVAVNSTNSDEANRTGWQSRKGMPIERLGDSIGDSLKDKIKVK